MKDRGRDNGDWTVAEDLRRRKEKLDLIIVVFISLDRIIVSVRRSRELLVTKYVRS